MSKKKNKELVKIKFLKDDGDIKKGRVLFIEKKNVQRYLDNGLVEIIDEQKEKEAKYLSDKATLDNPSVKKYLNQFKNDDGLYPELLPTANLKLINVSLESYQRWVQFENSEILSNIEKIPPEKVPQVLNHTYYQLIKVLKRYIDLDEDYYKILSLWIIGTYYHNNYNSYPYLFFNAMRGSGKSKTLKLTTKLSYNGWVMASPTEAVLFRTTGTLAIDEFEGLASKEKQSLRELLNAGYKKGTKIARMKTKKTLSGGSEMVVEEFEPYRPILMANIWGIEEVLADRCIIIPLERSNDPYRLRLLELFDSDENIKKIKKNLIQCSLCIPLRKERPYPLWNDFLDDIYNIYTYNTLTTLTTPNLHLKTFEKKLLKNDETTLETTPKSIQKDTNYNSDNIIPKSSVVCVDSVIKKTGNYTKKLEHFFNQVHDSQIIGRDLELFFPLLSIAYEIDEKIVQDIIKISKKIIKQKKIDEKVESRDILVLDFISRKPSGSQYYKIKELTNEFKIFLGDDDKENDWVNNKWFGRAVKRLSLVIDKRRMGGGIEISLNVQKARTQFSFLDK